MKKISLVLIIILAFACKKQAKEEGADKDAVEYQKENQIKEEPVFTIVMEVLVENDDVFEVFYQDLDNDKYSWKTKTKKKVKGKPNTQQVKFKLPREVFPTSLRVDFGKNENMGDIKFKSMKISYEDFVQTISQKEFNSFFVPNKYISFNKETGIITCLAIDGKYDPYFDSKPVFKKKLELEMR